MKKSITLLLLCLCFTMSAIASLVPNDLSIEQAEKNLTKQMDNLVIKARILSPEKQPTDETRMFARNVNDFLANYDKERPDFTQINTGIGGLFNEAGKLPEKNQGALTRAVSDVNKANDVYQDLLIAQGSQNGKNGSTENNQNGIPTNTNLSSTQKPPTQEGYSLTKFLVLGTPVVLSLFALGLGGIALGKVGGLRREVEQNQNRVNQSVDAMKREQSNAAAKMNTASSGDAGLSMRVAELQDEMQRMRDEMRSAQRAASVGAMTAASPVGATSSSNGSTPPEDVFPIAADAYLQKMQRTSTPLNPDPMNGVLVPATDGRAEFMLINDTTIAADAFFIIPSVAYFQSKQTFFTYYERYYDCQNPSSGAVWIRNPAVVEKVGNGWALREKGELEVR